jgi:hypothetical protein
VINAGLNIESRRRAAESVHSSEVGNFESDGAFWASSLLKGFIGLVLVKTVITHRRRHKAILGCASFCRTDLRRRQAAPLTMSESPAADASLLELSQRNRLKLGRNQRKFVERRAEENARCVGYGRCRGSTLDWRSKCIETGRLIRDHTDLDLWPLAVLIAANPCCNTLRAKATTKIKPMTKSRTKHHGFENIPHLNDALRPGFELRDGVHIRRRTRAHHEP